MRKLATDIKINEPRAFDALGAFHEFSVFHAVGAFGAVRARHSVSFFYHFIELTALLNLFRRYSRMYLNYRRMR